MTNHNTQCINAREAMDEYHAEIQAGGEPDYPQWAADILDAPRRAENEVRLILSDNDAYKLAAYLRASPTSIIMQVAAAKIEELAATVETQRSVIEGLEFGQELRRRMK